MLKDLKPALWILLRFLTIYIVLFLAYQWYLHETEPMGLDPYSRWIVEQVTALQNILGYASTTEHYPKQLTEVFLIENAPITRMVEGCNAISVTILCLAFIFAFYQGKKTIAYAMLSVFLLYITNILRIAGLNILYVERPEWGDAAHDYLFPTVIYGSVVIIWILWMRILLPKK